MTTRLEVVQQAFADVGVAEYPAYSNRTRLGVEFGWNGVSWCAIAISDWLTRVGIDFHDASVPDSVVRAQRGENGMRWHGGSGVTLLAGMAVIFNFPGEATYDHMSLCVDPYTQSRFRTVGGNETSPEGGAVRDQWRDRTYVVGAIDFPYDDYVTPASATVPIIQQSEVHEVVPGQCRDKVGRKWFFILGDDHRLWASVSGQPFFPIRDETWTSGFSAFTENDGLLVVAGRNQAGQLAQVLIYTDGGPKTAGTPPDYDVIGGHIAS